MIKLPAGHPYENGRTCSTCGEFKSPDEYQLEKDSRAFGGVAMRSKCRPCNEFRKYKRFIEKRYGITFEKYEELLLQQKNCCAICGDSVSGNSRTSDRLFIDHCHTTGEVRGLLCSRCNHGLGHFRDDIGLLKNAIKYLDSRKD